MLYMDEERGVDERFKGSRQQGSIPTKPRSRSVPDVVVLTSSKGFLLEYFLAGASLLAILQCGHLKHILEISIIKLALTVIALEYENF